VALLVGAISIFKRARVEVEGAALGGGVFFFERMRRRQVWLAGEQWMSLKKGSGLEEEEEEEEEEAKVKSSVRRIPNAAISSYLISLTFVSLQLAG